MDRLKMMESFVAVVKAKSFSAAAERLGMSRAIVTKHIGALEARLGARLLNRTTRRVALTETGADYYEFCTGILAELERRDGAIAREQSEPQGSLRVAVPTSFGAVNFPAAVSSFARKYPQIRVSLIVDNSSNYSVDIAANDFDVAVRLSPIPATAAVTARQIGALRWVACAAPAYLKRAGEPKTIADLARHNCMIHMKLAPDRIWRFGGAGRKKLTAKVGGDFSSNSIIVLRQAALDGIGIAMLPTYHIGEDLRGGALRRLLPQLPPFERPVNLLFPQGRMLPKKSRLFSEHLADWFKRGSWDAALLKKAG
jgi:DNA-binding transcriptional LysR family regulator